MPPTRRAALKDLAQTGDCRRMDPKAVGRENGVIVAGETKGYGPVRCAECGGESGRSPRCRQCGAPFIKRAEDSAPGIQAISHEAPNGPGAFQQGEMARNHGAHSPRAGGLDWGFALVVGLVNFFALLPLIAFTGMFLTRGSWDRPGENIYGYPPPWVCLLVAISCGVVPLLSVAVAVRRRVRHVRQRRALHSEPPIQLPELSD